MPVHSVSKQTGSYLSYKTRVKQSELRWQLNDIILLSSFSLSALLPLEGKLVVSWCQGGILNSRHHIFVPMGEGKGKKIKIFIPMVSVPFYKGSKFLPRSLLMVYTYVLLARTGAGMVTKILNGNWIRQLMVSAANTYYKFI